MDSVLEGYNGNTEMIHFYRNQGICSYVSLTISLFYSIHDSGTVLAYGQTGAGKTFTMQGIESSEEKRGIISNALHHIFQTIDGSTKEKVQRYFNVFYITGKWLNLTYQL